MEINFKKRDSFKVFGYKVETNLDSAIGDIGFLWSKYEEFLLKFNNNKNPLYGLMWYTEGHNYFYLIGIDDNKLLLENNFNDFDTIEIPSSNFAIASVPKNMDLIEAWTIYFEEKLPELGYIPDSNHGKYFEAHYNDGTCELWTPVIKGTGDD